jgi:tRNA threonylcarbamoyladenosine biosynthesis protein TsaB
VSEETLILSLDTATETRSVAVMRGDARLALVEGEGRNTHSANLLGEIDAALKGAGVGLGEIALFAAAAGPGSFTGVRAGLATLKAFAATLARPVVGVPTMHGVARAVADRHGRARERVQVLIPAGRGEVFAQMLSVERDGRVVELSAPEHVAPAALLERLVRGDNPSLTWAGSGAHMLAQMLEERAAQAGLRWTPEAGTDEAATGKSEPDAAESGEAESGATGSGETASVETATVERASLSVAGQAAGSDNEGDKHPSQEASGWRLARPARMLAEQIAALALRTFREGRAASAGDLQAIYVRPSDAEINERRD